MSSTNKNRPGRAEAPPIDQLLQPADRTGGRPAQNGARPVVFKIEPIQEEEADE